MNEKATRDKRTKPLYFELPSYIVLGREIEKKLLLVFSSHYGLRKIEKINLIQENK